MAEPENEESKEPVTRPWLKPVLAVVVLLVIAGGVGFGIGYLTRSDDSGPELTESEALELAQKKTLKEVSRDMARQGFDAGRKTGRSHGIIAGGMAAEAAFAIQVREQRAAQAQSDAASAQAELAGMTAAPAPPTP